MHDIFAKSSAKFFLSFRRTPESRLLHQLQNLWTPVFTGVTIFYEAVIIVAGMTICRISGEIQRSQSFNLILLDQSPE
jgi:hypothetical protein